MLAIEMSQTETTSSQQCLEGHGFHGKIKRAVRKSQLCLRSICIKKEHPSQPFSRLLFSPNPVHSLSGGGTKNNSKHNNSSNGLPLLTSQLLQWLGGRFPHMPEPVCLMVISVSRILCPGRQWMRNNLGENGARDELREMFCYKEAFFFFNF